MTKWYSKLQKHVYYFSHERALWKLILRKPIEFTRREKLINSRIYFRNGKEIKTTFRGLKNDARSCDWRPIEVPWLLIILSFHLYLLLPNSLLDLSHPTETLRHYVFSLDFVNLVVPTHQIDYYMYMWPSVKTSDWIYVFLLCLTIKKILYCTLYVFLLVNVELVKLAFRYKSVVETFKFTHSFIKIWSRFYVSLKVYKHG